MLSLAQTIGIVGTMILTLCFSKKQIQSLAIDQQTRVLNDLDEKFLRMAELSMEDPQAVCSRSSSGGGGGDNNIP